MKCTISIDDKKLKEFVGKNITEEKFASFCKDAVLVKLWEEQITKRIDMNTCKCSDPDNDAAPYGNHCLACGGTIRTA